MSGHSKWATIKHKKAATDAKRGRIFTKLIREITIAARVGGGDADSNPRLRTAILAAKNENMPNDNIERALQRGIGQLEGEQFEEVNFEGYGPGGVGMMVQVVTTNRNRVVSDIRHLMSKHGGNLGTTGSVGFQFQKMGVFRLEPAGINQDELELEMIDYGLEEMGESSGDKGEPQLVLRCAFENFGKLQEALEARRIAPLSAEHDYVCTTTIELPEAQATEALELIDKLEQEEDVQRVFHSLA